MDLPKFNETFIPILEILRDGKIIKGRELIRRVEENFYSHLPYELLQQTTKSGDRVIENRIAWGKSYLKKGGLVHYPQRGFVQITDKGLFTKAENITLPEIQADVINFYQPENSKPEKLLIEEESASPQDLIDTGFERIEREIKDELLSKLKTIDPYAFEKIILILLKKMGYGEFIETSKSGDGGIDGIINEDQLGLEKIYIQAKRYNENKVRETDIRNFIGAMSGDTHKGIFVTTSSFDEKAKNKARDAHHKIILLDGSKLVDLMHKYNVGVQVKNIYEVKTVDNDFFDSEDI
ncbi:MULTISPECIES: restriction endonuclease [Pseudomonadaceae]|nr:MULTISPECIES: restriction endonuclease [Pseudomonas]MCR1828173.1 restriction endonuclease [Pseudomonas oleovorans]MDG9979895.1 restriction endonuclease [Pseudomonas oleovorans]MDH0568725.1 restriction endonuclease [Pseudomonas oleovorans]OWK39323.1 Mrr restriction system protein [Pseudomonas oleovorans subsp. oleovorans]SEJ80312.1 restriction system protein [Pseudomonas oleovorans]